jgi:uncharacterized protein (TIGR00251 family)
MRSISESKDGVLLTIYVKPNSPKFRLEQDGDELVVYATQEPEKGKVNKEILKEASKLLGFGVELASGATSRQKVLLIRGADKAAVEAALKRK